MIQFMTLIIYLFLSADKPICTVTSTRSNIIILIKPFFILEDLPDLTDNLLLELSPLSPITF